METGSVRYRRYNPGTTARDRIEQREQQQPGEEAADMRLPGDRHTFGPDADGADAEHNVDAEPDRQKSQHARIAERTPQRLCRDKIGRAHV